MESILLEGAKLFGAFGTLAILLFIAITYWKQTNSFTSEYKELLEQYKDRNSILEDEIDRQKENCEAEIESLKEQMTQLRHEISYLRNLVAIKHPEALVQ